MNLTHEQKVEKFYTHGSRVRGCQEGGYLSFGFWTDKTQHYHEAVKNLINRVLSMEDSKYPGLVLNVCCGYGAETFDIFHQIHPNKIIGIDITEAHILFARKLASQQKLSDRIHFEQMDACKIPYKSNTFNYIVGIEGPAHFNTREQFLRRAYDVLKPKGVLLLTDVIVNTNIAMKNHFNKLIGKFGSKFWHMPKENWYNADELTSLLDKIGFEVHIVEKVGEHVYPGYARFNLKWSSIINAIQIRGFFPGLGLTFISWLIGFAYKKGMVDYVVLKAVKK